MEFSDAPHRARHQNGSPDHPYGTINARRAQPSPQDLAVISVPLAKLSQRPRPMSHLIPICTASGTPSLFEDHNVLILLNPVIDE